MLAGVLVLFSAAEERLADAHGGGALAARSVRARGRRSQSAGMLQMRARSQFGQANLQECADGRASTSREFGPVCGRGSLVRIHAPVSSGSEVCVVVLRQKLGFCSIKRARPRTIGCAESCLDEG